MKITITCPDIPGYTPDLVRDEIKSAIIDYMAVPNVVDLDDFENNLKITVEKE